MYARRTERRSASVIDPVEVAAAVAGVSVPEADVVVDAGREVVAGVSRDAGPGVLEASIATGVGKPEEGWWGGYAEALGMGSEVVHVYSRPVWRGNGGGIGEGRLRR